MAKKENRNVVVDGILNIF